MRRAILVGLLSAGLAAGCGQGAGTTTTTTTATSETAQSAPAASPSTSAAPSSPAGAAVAPAAPPAPAPTEPAPAPVRHVTLPAGTELPVVLDTAIGSDTSRVEEAVRAHLARSVSHGGEIALAEGSVVSGVVTSAIRSGKVKGRAHVAVRFDALTPVGDSHSYRIDTAAVGRTAPATKKKDVLEIGAPAAGAAIIGGLIGGKKGALIGTAAGGGAGTAVVLSTRGREIHLVRGARLTLRLREPVTLDIR